MLPYAILHSLTLWVINWTHKSCSVVLHFLFFYALLFWNPKGHTSGHLELSKYDTCLFAHYFHRQTDRQTRWSLWLYLHCVWKTGPKTFITSKKPPEIWHPVVSRDLCYVSGSNKASLWVKRFRIHRCWMFHMSCPVRCFGMSQRPLLWLPVKQTNGFQNGDMKKRSPWAISHTLVGMPLRRYIPHASR